MTVCYSEEDEIIECDGCGILVHEGCYGTVEDDAISVHSNMSTESTEPWFCDPCKAGVTPVSDRWSLKEINFCFYYLLKKCELKKQVYKKKSAVLRSGSERLAINRRLTGSEKHIFTYHMQMILLC